MGPILPPMSNTGFSITAVRDMLILLYVEHRCRAGPFGKNIVLSHDVPAQLAVNSSSCCEKNPVV